MGEKMTLEQVREWHLEKAMEFVRMQNRFPNDSTVLTSLEKMHQDMADALDTPAKTVDVEFDEGDLFWPDDDGEQCADSLFNLADSLFNLLEGMHANGQIDSGEVIRVRRARNLPPIEVTITTLENGDFCDYKLSQAIGDKT